MKPEADRSEEKRLQGRRLKRARISAGYESARKAALANGWKILSYQQHETGRRGIRIPVARDYANAFGVDVNWLLTGTSEPLEPGFAVSFSQAEQLVVLLTKLIDERIAEAMKSPARRWRREPLDD